MTIIPPIHLFVSGCAPPHTFSSISSLFSWVGGKKKKSLCHRRPVTSLRPVMQCTDNSILTLVIHLSSSSSTAVSSRAAATSVQSIDYYSGKSMLGVMRRSAWSKSKHFHRQVPRRRGESGPVGARKGGVTGGITVNAVLFVTVVAATTGSCCWMKGIQTLDINMTKARSAAGISTLIRLEKLRS